PSIVFTPLTSFPTPTRTTSARTRSMFIQSGLPHANCGANRPLRATPFTLTFGMTILKRPDSNSGSTVVYSTQVDALPSIPHDEGGPVFAEPWQAQAFALAVRLSEQGYFTWKEWAAALADELKAAAERGEPDDGSRYYEHWLVVLERLV